MPRQRSVDSKWPRRAPTTGVRLPEELVLRAKHRALDEKKTLGELIAQALKDYLTKK